MTSRRHFLTLTGLFLAGTAMAQTEDLCAVSTKETQAATTADQALLRLKAGNERFRTGRSLHCDLMGQVKATAGGQAPFAAVLGCMDSRVAPEMGGVGYVPVENLVGRAEFILGSWDFPTTTNAIGSWFQAIRMSRFLSAIS